MIFHNLGLFFVAELARVERRETRIYTAVCYTIIGARFAGPVWPATACFKIAIAFNGDECFYIVYTDYVTQFWSVCAWRLLNGHCASKNVNRDANIFVLDVWKLQLNVKRSSFAFVIYAIIVATMYRQNYVLSATTVALFSEYHQVPEKSVLGANM